jgi:hypothetical protein
VETTITGQPFAPPVLEYTIDDKDIRDSVAECPNAGK